MTVDIPSLRIASQKTEWGVEMSSYISERPNREEAEFSASYFDEHFPDSAPHRVVSRQVIITEWEEARS